MTVDISAHRKYIEAALEYAGGTHAVEDIQAGINAGSLQFWPGPNSAIVTEIIEYPRQRALNFFLAGGTLPELEVMVPHIEQWGRERGCTIAVFTGRPGWERTFLKNGGWRSKLAVFEKGLSPDGEEGRR